MMNTRNGPLSPVSTAESAEWSPLNRYTNLSTESPYSPAFPPSRGDTPPTSVHGSSSTDGGGLPNGPPRPNGNPSPPNSVGRSSDGAGLYAQSLNEQGMTGRKMMVLEETLGEHYRVLKNYLGPYLRDEKGNPRPSRAKDKLTRLSGVQFQELSTDVYDESIRRETDRRRGGPGAQGNETPKYLLPKQTFHPKRNQARQKLSTLPIERFRQLATDVYYELERRYPRFGGSDMPPRPVSPAGSMASRGSRGPPSRMGTPNSMNGGMRGGRPPPGGYRGPPPPGMAGPPGSLRPGGPPLPKTSQQNTIVPNKGMMVEDDDSGADDDDAFNLEGAAARRQTNKSAKSIGEAQEKIISDLQKQVTELQGKINSLEETLQTKDTEVVKMQDSVKQRDGTSASERAQWDDLRESLEEKVDNAESLNSSLRADIDRLRTENADTERKLRAQIEHLEANPPQAAYNVGEEWKERCEDLERELNEQQQITDEVRRDAQTFLQEMKELSSRGDAATEREEQFSRRVSSLELELKEWKQHYARAKTQLRNMKSSSIGLSSLAAPDVSNYTRDAKFASPDGLVKDVHVTQFQLGIDELLQVARRLDSEQVLETMKHVVKCVRAITGDVDGPSLSALQSPISSVNGGMSNPEKQQTKLKSRVSATANNLITASKNHAASSGLSPVSLLDAAASHLSTAVIELVKLVKVRPTPEGELEQEEKDDRPMPLKPTTYSPVGYTAYSPNAVSFPLPNHQRHRSKGGSSSTTRYSNYSSPYSGYDRQSIMTNGGGYGKDAGMTTFKVY
jgi:predicted nuclease with TOPRIM domain